jgi:hypothetical protein
MRNSGVFAGGLMSLVLFFAFRCHAQMEDLQLANPNPTFGNFYSLQKTLSGVMEPPLPFNPYPDADVWACFTCDSNFVWYFYDDRDVDYDTPTQNGATRSAEFESGEGESDWAPAYNYPSNSLYLEITGLSSNLDTAFLLVHGTRSGEVYELKSTVLLTNHVLTAWNTEQAIHGSNDVTATSVPLLDRTNTLFFWARLWTTNDENSNSIPDWWEWENFGNLNQPTNGDYDSDILNNLQEYLTGTDPNTITFLITLANSAVNASGAPLHLAILAGVPSSMAVLVDNTNLATASWKKFNSDITVNLGATEGWHEVWVGLRGRKTDSQQTWRKTRVKLDVTPPFLVITNPASTSASLPVIELQGYSQEPLASFSYDLTNAAGLLTNQLVFVTGQAYTTNTWEATTNFFQAFDVVLTNGANIITLRATDLAGNTMITNITLNLDYASKTNPPALQLQWPQNGTRVATNSFSWRGRLDDQTVQIVAQFSDGIRGTNSVAGTVRRDGQFRIENLPLAAGTNAFTLVATDAAGNQTVTNVSVIRGVLSMTISSLSWSDASGRINDSNYKVWVNGKEATLDGSGGWSADVPLTVSNPTLQVRAIPNSDNSGNGTGGGGAANWGNSANPDSSEAADCEAEMTWPNGIVQMTTVILSEYRLGLPYSTGDDTNGYSDSVNWTENRGGNELTYYAATNSHGTNIFWDGTVSWPGTEIPQWPDGIFTSLVDGSTNSYPPPAPTLNGAVNSAALDYADDHLTWNWHEDDQVTLVTADSSEPELYTISGTGAYFIFPAPGYPFVDPIWSNVPPEQIAVSSFGNLDTNGNLLVVLPPRATLDITPHACGGGGSGGGGGGGAPPANTGTTSLGVTAQKDDWISETIATTPADISRTNLGVGEEVALHWSRPLPWKPVYSISGGGSIRQWNLEGTVYHFFAPSNKATVTITATFSATAKKTKTFQIFEPTGVDHTTIRGTDSYTSGVSGAGMYVDVFIGPTNVSFYKTEMMEIGEDASDISGYFTTRPPPSHKGNGADVPHGIGQDNLVGGGMDHCYLSPLASPWTPGGSFTWHIPAVWRVVGDGRTNNLPWSDQLFSLDAIGTLTISKFGHSVTRTTTNGVTSH